MLVHRTATLWGLYLLLTAMSPANHGHCATLYWVGDGAANKWNTSSITWSGTASPPATLKFANGDSVTFAGGLTNNTVSLDVPVAPVSIKVNAAGSYTLQGVGSIQGTTGLVKQGAGTLTIKNTNSFSGETDIDEGEVVVTAGAKLGEGSYLSIGNAAGKTGKLTMIDAGPMTVRYPDVAGVAGADGQWRMAGNSQVTSADYFVTVAEGINSSGLLSLEGASTLTLDTTHEACGLWVGNKGTGTVLLKDDASLRSVASGWNNIAANDGNLAGAVANGTVVVQDRAAMELVSLLTLAQFYNTTTQKAGTALLQVRNQGAVTIHSELGVAWGRMSRGTVELYDSARLAVDRLTLADDDQSAGSLTLSQASSATVHGDLIAALDAGSTASITLNGTSSLSVAGNFNIAQGGSGSVNLNGGTLKTSAVKSGFGNSAVHFNGGAIQATAANADFLQDLDHVYVQAGGALIDTNGFDIGIAQSLEHDPGLSALDGGLTKTGAGRLVLSGNNTYSGPTAVLAGILEIPCPAALPAGSLTIGSGGTVVLASGLSAAGAAGTASAAAAVPEAGTLALLVAGTLAGLPWWLRRQHRKSYPRSKSRCRS